MKIEVDLAWPPRGLSPNARLTFFAKAQLYKRTKWDAQQRTRLVLVNGNIQRPSFSKKERGAVNVTLVCTPPVTRYHDEDNMLANCKAVLDGVAAALGIDDTIFHFREQQWLPASKPGVLKLIVDWEEK